jgi:hypothetical protein|tara:strand:+ start:26 stop:202 length:177 start_codon:yes stop_codon:yes gene_type:complete
VERVGDEVFNGFLDGFRGVGSEGGIDVLAMVVGLGVKDVAVIEDLEEVDVAAVTRKLD